MSQMTNFKVIIIGAGLAGALLANGLIRENVDFVVYEREEKDARREGYQVRLGAPALKGLRKCLSKDQLDALLPKFGRSGGVVSSAPVLYSPEFKVRLDMTKFPAYAKSAPIDRVVLANALADPLHDAGKIVYGKRFKRYDFMYDDQGRTKVKVFFEDGTSDIGDLLVSAEGSGSLINAQIGLNNIVQRTEKWGFVAKGILPMSKLRGLPPEIRRSALTCNKNGVIIFFSAYMPRLARSGKQYEAASSLGPREYDDTDASIMWAASIPQDRVPEGGKGITDRLQFVLDQIKDWNPRFHVLLQAVKKDDIYMFQAKSSTEPPKNWRQTTKCTHDPKRANDHVWLMGDAIHPMTPSRGMGGNQAMNDTADVLPAILSLANKARSERELYESDFASAVHDYESRMIPRAFYWVKTSSRTGSGLPEPDSWKGNILLFVVAQILNLSYLFILIRTLLGYKPKDDAPELRD